MFDANNDGKLELTELARYVFFLYSQQTPYTNRCCGNGQIYWPLFFFLSKDYFLYRKIFLLNFRYEYSLF